jgi:drug/metabolite transporter (DMT)-like permease
VLRGKEVKMPQGGHDAKSAGLSGGNPLAYAFAALAMVFWSGNWVLGRAVRADIPPLGLNFWRWSTAAVVLLPFAISQARRDWPIVRRHWKIVLALSATGASLFHGMVYIGLRATEVINALLLNSIAPIMVVVLSWVVFRDTITRRQVFGISVSLLGVLILVARGDVAALASLQFNSGDLWILGALFVWGIYSILLKRRPVKLGGLSLLFYICVAGVVLMLPAYLWEYALGARMALDVPTIASAVYTGVFASIAAYLCYNAAVARIGPNTTSFFLHLMPVFGAVLAIVFLGETLRLYHLAGFVVVLCGIFLATFRLKA